jgi:hypothetical protein
MEALPRELAQTVHGGRFEGGVDQLKSAPGLGE